MTVRELLARLVLEPDDAVIQTRYALQGGYEDDSWLEYDWEEATEVDVIEHAGRKYICIS